MCGFRKEKFSGGGEIGVVVILYVGVVGGVVLRFIFGNLS